MMQESILFKRQGISDWGCPDVNERYEHLSKVGAGTYGEVHKARSKTDPNQLVALKKIKDERETEGFPITALREISILQQCDHPNIVKLLDVVTAKATPGDGAKKKTATYLVFEYMNHELLGLTNSCELTLPQVKCITKQILEGLAYMHSKNILHRDIKSANILMNNKGEVKIADFGLAKAVNPRFGGRLTQRVVTRWYRAPELLLGSRNYTNKIDVWALGCVFAELLIGKSQPLFKAQKTPDQFEKICEKCGTPDENQWPSLKALPFYPHVAPKKNYPKTLMQYMRKQKNNLDSLSLDLLEKMLTINPDDRITAKEALQHPFFTTAPLPCELSEMPVVENDCHAYVLKTQLRESIDMNKQIEAVANKGVQENVVKGTMVHTNNGYNLNNLPNKPISILIKNDPKLGSKNQGKTDKKEYMKQMNQSLNTKRMGTCDISDFEEVTAKKQLVDPVKYTN